MKKIIISLAVIGVVSAAVIGGTIAYFSDTETSTGNTFTAGAIDLKIDNESYAIDYTIPNHPSPIGAIVKSNNTSWTLDDLTGKVFFNFIDLKPGDIGEDTISIHVNNNDAWACLAIEMTEDSDNTCTEPEKADDSDCAPYTDDTATHFNGELAGKLQIAVWADDGDNVYETHERLLQLGGAPGHEIVTIKKLAGLSESGGPAGVLTLADSGYSVFTDDPNLGEPLVGGTEYYLAKAWCFGDLSITPLSSGSHNPTTAGNVTCNGVNVNNASQTDRVMGNITFYAEQARNNDDFTCVSRF